MPAIAAEWHRDMRCPGAARGRAPAAFPGPPTTSARACILKGTGVVWAARSLPRPTTARVTAFTQLPRGPQSLALRQYQVSNDVRRGTVR